jgi:hypothetical protein
MIWLLLNDAVQYDRMVSLVERMLALHLQHAAAQMPQDKELIQRHIYATDRLVHALYGLTEEEIRTVEGTQFPGNKADLPRPVMAWGGFVSCRFQQDEIKDMSNGSRG